MHRRLRDQRKDDDNSDIYVTGVLTKQNSTSAINQRGEEKFSVAENCEMPFTKG